MSTLPEAAGRQRRVPRAVRRTTAALGAPLKDRDRAVEQRHFSRSAFFSFLRSMIASESGKKDSALKMAGFIRRMVKLS
jgi:hypothetical protein